MRLEILKGEKVRQGYKTGIMISSKVSEEKHLDFVVENIEKEFDVEVSATGDRDETETWIFAIEEVAREEIGETQKELKKLYMKFKKEFAAAVIDEPSAEDEIIKVELKEEIKPVKVNTIKVKNIEDNSILEFPSQSALHKYLKDMYGGAGTDAVRALVKGKREIYKNHKMVN